MAAVGDYVKLDLLVHQAQKGNMEAFNEIYRMTYQAQYCNVLSLVKDAQEAQDVLQEAYLLLYQHMDRIHPPSAIIAYLNKLCFFVSKNRLKSESRRRYRQVEIENIEALPGEECDPVEKVLLEERAEQVRKAVNRLKPRDQLYVNMRYGQGMKLKNIAFAMDLSLPTVKRISKSVKEELRGYLEEQGLSGFFGLSLTLSRGLRFQSRSVSIPPFEEKAAGQSTGPGADRLFHKRFPHNLTIAGLAVAGGLTAAVCTVASVNREARIPSDSTSVARSDTTYPVAEKLVFEDGILTVWFVEEESGIDFDEVYCINEAGMLTRPYRHSAKENTASFQIPKGSQTLYFADNAGNTCSAPVTLVEPDGD